LSATSSLLEQAQYFTPKGIGVARSVLLQNPVRVPVALAEKPEEQMLAPDLRGTHLPSRRERQLQSPLRARRERENLLAGVAAPLTETRLHTIHVRPAPAQSLGRHVLTRDDSGEEMVGADRGFATRSGGHLAASHHRFLRFLSQSLEQTSTRRLALLVDQILEHLERVHPAGVSPAAPDHAKLPGALRTQISRCPILTLLLENLHARRTNPAILTNHLKPPVEYDVPFPSQTLLVTSQI
jgi:hypothetical protein